MTQHYVRFEEQLKCRVPKQKADSDANRNTVELENLHQHWQDLGKSDGSTGEAERCERDREDLA